MRHTFPKFGYNPVTGEWNDSLLGKFLWSSVNVSEAVPDVMTPSTWSLWWIYHYEANPIKFPGDYPFCGNICGRPYLNLSLLASLYRAVGKDFHKELQGDMIGSAPAKLDIPSIQFSPLTVLWNVIPGMLKAQRSANRDNQTYTRISRHDAGLVPNHAHDNSEQPGCGESAFLVDAIHQTRRSAGMQPVAQRNHGAG
jgi:hypothetical protein